MPEHTICWEITDTFAKFGFGDGDGPNFTDHVVAAIDAAGPYRCHTQTWGLHNYAIVAIDELPPWDALPQAARDALVALNGGAPLDWRL